MNHRPRTKLHYVLSIAFALAVTHSAAAQELGDDEVALKNGGSIRGTVVSLIPGESVKVIEAGSTQPTTYEWSQVARVKKGKYAHHDDAHPAAPAQDMVHVHIESPEPAELRHEIATSVGSVDGYAYGAVVSESACTSPCDQDVPAGKYFIDGAYPRSGAFQLSGDTANVVVKPGSSGRVVGGIFAIVGAVAGVSIGAPVAVSGNGTAGGIIIGVGGASLITGIVLLATCWTSAQVNPPTTASAGVTFAPWAAAAPGATEDAPTASAPSVVNPLNGVLGLRATF